MTTTSTTTKQTHNEFILDVFLKEQHGNHDKQSQHFLLFISVTAAAATTTTREINHLLYGINKGLYSSQCVSTSGQCPS